MADRVLYKARRVRLVVIAFLLCPLMTGAAVVLGLFAVDPSILSGFLPQSILYRALCAIIGIAGSLVFGLFTVAGILMALRSDVGLVIDADGFTDSSSFTAAGRVRWDEVTGWHINEMQGQRILCVAVTDVQAVLDRMGPVTRLFGRGNVKLVGTPVCIGLSNLSGTPQEILGSFGELSQGRGAHEAR
ncbi:STM3941 family protein [Promicromonospora sp. NPDC023805]|uniref:STM3941 family protein n=1 Tax=Promicromonospora sp. NPDC023805 TaxID=3154696 RepID=UPI0033C7C580